MNRKYFAKTFLIIGTILMITASSCEIPSPFDPTPTIPPTLTPTQFCPPFGSFPTPPPVSLKPQLVVVLFEDNPGYHKYAMQGLQILNQALVDSIEPGDDLLILKMEYYTLEGSIVGRSKVRIVNPPAIPPFPTPFPTLTATASPPTPITRISELGATQDALTAIAAMNMTATQQTFLTGCSEDEWRLRYQQRENQWKEEKADAVDEFFGNLESQEELFDDCEPIAKTAVWDGLAHVTEIFQNECSAYSRCALIIFSDMDEVVMSRSDLKIDLKNVEVLGVMLNCDLLYSGQCGHWTQFWRDNLRVKSIDYINSENAVEAIRAFLRR